MNHFVTGCNLLSTCSKDQMYTLLPNDRLKAGLEPAPQTLLSFSRSSSWVAGTIFSVMDPWDCAWKESECRLIIPQVWPFSSHLTSQVSELTFRGESGSWPPLGPTLLWWHRLN